MEYYGTIYASKDLECLTRIIKKKGRKIRIEGIPTKHDYFYRIWVGEDGEATLFESHLKID